MYDKEDAVSLELVVEADFLQQEKVHKKDNDAASIEELHADAFRIADGKERVNDTEDNENIERAKSSSDRMWYTLDEVVEVE